MARRLKDDFKRKPSEVILGFAGEIKNPTLNMQFFGAPFQLQYSISEKFNMSLQDAMEHPDSHVFTQEIRQVEPLLQFHGGPHTERLMLFLDHFANGEYGKLDELADVLQTDCDGAYGPLLSVVSRGDFDAVDLLLKLGSIVDLPGDFGMTPLHWASARGHEKVIQVLLQAGGSLSQRSWFCLNSAEIADLNGHHRIAAQLGQNNPMSVQRWSEITFQRMRDESA